MSPVHAAKMRTTTIDQAPREAVAEIVTVLKVSPSPEGEVSLRVKPDRRVRQDPLTGSERRFSLKAPTT